MGEIRIVGGSAVFSSPVGNRSQEIENAVFWAYHEDKTTMAQMVTALGGDYQNPAHVKNLKEGYAEWRRKVIGLEAERE